MQFRSRTNARNTEQDRREVTNVGYARAEGTGQEQKGKAREVGRGRGRGTAFVQSAKVHTNRVEYEQAEGASDEQTKEYQHDQIVGRNAQCLRGTEIRPLGPVRIRTGRVHLAFFQSAPDQLQVSVAKVISAGASARLHHAAHVCPHTARLLQQLRTALLH